MGAAWRGQHMRVSGVWVGASLLRGKPGAAMLCANAELEESSQLASISYSDAGHAARLAHHT